ncbi:MAG: NYN domain-containing protein [Chthonomonadales bacterium]|nr:NYN domain-containing protein [Chthonomonadales bacterium]
MERVSVFVDGANMYYAQKRLGWFIDYRKVLNHFAWQADHELSEAYYFTGADQQPRGRDSAFREYLNHAGYTVRAKSIKQVMDDATGETIEKANLDIEIVIDMFNTLSRYDTCVLMSGDGDFERMVEVLRARGKRVVVVALPEMTARELRNAAGSNFVDLRQLETFIARTDRMPDHADDAPAGSTDALHQVESR